MRFAAIHCSLLLVLTALGSTAVADGNRLTYLDENNPYYVSRSFPKLITPQWVGEEGVEAVVILGIDDMRGYRRWEGYLRPILERLKKIDGRAPVSIMTCTVNRREPHLQRWLREGVSIECHTIDHPCPLLQGGDFAKAKSTYDRCVDLLHSVPGNRPVAFRMPCCDSLNTVSPRFYAEIFNKTTEKGNFLSIDTSVFNVFTSDDPEIPRELVIDADGRDKFLKYIPADRTFVNTIENYPYPYVINRLCWEFPCVAPSDWSAQHYQGKNSAKTVRDLKAALDITVLKQGVFCLVFHPHGWIHNEQIVQLIDHAVKKHGQKVKFLTFREALERLNKHLLNNTPIRSAEGHDNGVRLLDVNDDGYMDVAIGGLKFRQMRIWSARDRSWTYSQPIPVLTRKGDRDAMVPFGIFRVNGDSSVMVNLSLYPGGTLRFDGKKWIPQLRPRAPGEPFRSLDFPYTLGKRLRDLDGDGQCELIVWHDRDMGHDIFRWSARQKVWRKLPFPLPGSCALA